MSSVVRSPKTKYIGHVNYTDACDTHLGKATIAAQSSEAVPDAATNENPPPLAFNSLTLNKLSMELDICTKEAQKLQEELEIATKVTLGRFCGAHTDCMSNICGALGELVQNQIVTEYLNENLDCSDQEAMAPRAFNKSGNAEFENAMDDCIQQLTNLEMNESHEQTSRQQDAYILKDPIMNLHTKLQKANMNKDVSELRLKDSKKHVDEMEKMLHLLEEVQVTKRFGDQRLQKTEEEALVLNRKIETLEKILIEYHAQLSPEVQCWPNSNTLANDETLRLLYPSAKNDNNQESESQPNKNALPRQPLLNQECNGVKKKEEQVEKLIDCIGQEMAVLSGKLSSSKSSSVSLIVKLELLKKLTEKRFALHDAQVIQLKKTLSNHERKFSFMEEHLTYLQSQLLNAQREKAKLLTQTEELKDDFKQKKVCCEPQQHELQEEVKTLRGQLEVAWEQLRRTGEEKTSLEALLEQRTQEGKKSQKLLDEKKVELELKQQESQQHMALLDEARDLCQKLHTETEALRMKLKDKENILETLRLRLESSFQQAAQYSSTTDNLHQENSLLGNQLRNQKREILQLRAELDQHKSSLAAVEHQKCQLQASVAEQNHRVQEETLAKRQLSIELEKQGLQLLTLTEEHKELQLLYSCKNKENKGVVLKLQSHLKNVQTELNQVRSTLRTLEGTDGHGFQVALSMQKEITARRKHVDSLQSKIKHLEETKEKLSQEKLYQNLENKRQFQELVLVRTEKKQLVKELEAVQSKDKYLRERINELEAVLHKMSGRFADCQDFIHLQEQEYYRLKIKHALDLKERHSQNLCTPLNYVTDIAHKDSPTSDLGCLFSDLQGVISKNHRPHTVNSVAASSVHRRRSAQESVQRNAFSADKTEVKGGIRLRRTQSGSDSSHRLKNIKLNGKMHHHNSFSQEPLTSTPTATCPQLLGRRSPVHTLLTSAPNS